MDATEEQQLEMALQASLREVASSSATATAALSRSPDSDSDNDDNVDGDDDEKEEDSSRDRDELFSAGSSILAPMNVPSEEETNGK